MQYNCAEDSILIYINHDVDVCAWWTLINLSTIYTFTFPFHF